MVNNTDQPIVKLWTRPTTSAAWFEAINVYVPKDDKSQQIKFDREAQGPDCYQDIKFLFEGGTTRQIEHVHLCAVTTITISVNDNGMVTYRLDAPTGSNDTRNLILGVIVIGLALAIYFLPTTIASKRKIAMGASAMFWINLLVAWTGIGWLFLILLAACAKTQAEDSYYQKAVDDRVG